jgi:polyphosphate:AMP phosphotransferase
MLIDDGALILKFWLHLSKNAQKKRLKKLEHDPHTKRSVSKKDWLHHKKYDLFTEVAERVISHTDMGYAPWILVEATDSRYRNLTVGRTLLRNLQKRLAQTMPTLTENTTGINPILPVEESADVTVLDKVNLSQHLSNKTYQKQLATYQGKLHRLAREAYHQKRSTIIVFEGWDAAGKGGAIRRITQAMDARLYRVISTAAPTDEERAHHYLWRFWRHISRAGTFTMYDRSWYGRVLVERVEGFASEQEWQRAYSEINDFEAQLVEHHNIVIKFWLHIDQEEQLRRFKDREQIPYKQHKITEEDWRNREKWPQYRQAVNDMIARTSTHFAPWTLISGNDKRFARVQVLKTVCDALEAVLEKKD